MKIKYSALVMGVSGKLNGSVGATNKGGAYLRNKGVTSNPQTIAQQAVRSRFGALSSQFRALTILQIVAWNTAAAQFPIIDRLGDQRFLTGLGLFVQLNTNLLTVGAPTIQDPPLKQSMPSFFMASFIPTVNAASLAVAQINLQLDAQIFDNEYALVVKAAPYHSPSITNVKNQLRLVTAEDLFAGGTVAVDVSSATQAKFGSFIAGQVLSVEAYFVSLVSGEASAPFKLSNVIALVP